jgi:membrane protein YdbS with pleckstrin-like domain
MIESTDWHHLDPKVKTLWRISALISGVMIGGVVLVLDLFLLRRGLEVFILFPGFIALTATVFIAVFGFVFVDAKFKNTKYRVGDDDLASVHGIFWKKQRFINRARVQHVDITTGLFAGWLGLTEVSVHVGGQMGAAITISGLTPVIAEELRRRLLEGSMVKYQKALEVEPPPAPPPIAQEEAPSPPPTVASQDERA